MQFRNITQLEMSDISWQLFHNQ